jgi:hypothetical protein
MQKVKFFGALLGSIVFIIAIFVVVLKVANKNNSVGVACTGQQCFVSKKWLNSVSSEEEIEAEYNNAVANVAANALANSVANNKNFNINAVDSGGNSALMYMVRNNKNPQSIKKMVELGADVNLQNNAGYSALIFAADSNKYPEIVEMLLKLGANKSIKTFSGETALDKAKKTFASRPEVLIELIKLLN